MGHADSRGRGWPIYSFNKLLKVISNSKLWQFMVPLLHKVGQLYNNRVSRYLKHMKHMLKWPHAMLQRMMRLVIQLLRKILLNTGLKKQLSQKLNNYPYLKYRLRQLVVWLRLLNNRSSYYKGGFDLSQQNSVDSNTDNLSPHAVKIYLILQDMLAEQEKEKKKNNAHSN